MPDEFARRKLLGASEMSSPRQTPVSERLALELAAGATLKGAAKAAGVSESTAHRYRTDPAFRKRVAELQATMMAEALGRLTNACSAAAAVPTRVMLEEKDHSVRVRAANSILAQARDVREHTQLADRLAELEHYEEVWKATRRRKT
jgi:hypothetical protein